MKSVARRLLDTVSLFRVDVRTGGDRALYSLPVYLMPRFGDDELKTSMSEERECNCREGGALLGGSRGILLYTMMYPQTYKKREKKKDRKKEGGGSNLERRLIRRKEGETISVY